jgi:polyhydroxyalkanoate synthesis regulator phasin
LHNHIRKWGHWNPEKSPHDVPHNTVAPRLLRDYYKRARAEAEEEEARVRQRMNEAVDDPEGFSAQEQDPNKQMEDMIEDLPRPARRHGSER